MPIDKATLVDLLGEDAHITDESIFVLDNHCKVHWDSDYRLLFIDGSFSAEQLMGIAQWVQQHESEAHHDYRKQHSDSCDRN